MNKIAETLVSVDCVVMGFDGEDMNVLLVKRSGEEGGEAFHDMKLPGGLVYDDENLDLAASRILHDLTGLDNISMFQYRTYGSAHRTDNPKDVHWLEKAMKMKISRIITVAYIAAINIDEKIKNSIVGTEAIWVKLRDVPALAFDHNAIVADSFEFVKRMLTLDDNIVFSILPKKFTILQYRQMLESITGRKIDNANIYKKVAQMPYIVPLKEKETGMMHRAARFFKYDSRKRKKKF